MRSSHHRVTRTPELDCRHANRGPERHLNRGEGQTGRHWGWKSNPSAELPKEHRQPPPLHASGNPKGETRAHEDTPKHSAAGAQPSLGRSLKRSATTAEEAGAVKAAPLPGEAFSPIGERTDRMNPTAGERAPSMEAAA